MLDMPYTFLTWKEAESKSEEAPVKTVVSARALSWGPAVQGGQCGRPPSSLQWDPEPLSPDPAASAAKGKTLTPPG